PRARGPRAPRPELARRGVGPSGPRRRRTPGGPDRRFPRAGPPAPRPADGPLGRDPPVRSCRPDPRRRGVVGSYPGRGEGGESMVLYLVAVLMAAVLVIALWRLLGPDQVATRDRAPRGPRPPRRPRGLPGSLGGGTKSVPPDDNPEF